MILLSLSGIDGIQRTHVQGLASTEIILFRVVYFTTVTLIMNSKTCLLLLLAIELVTMNPLKIPSPMFWTVSKHLTTNKNPHSFLLILFQHPCFETIFQIQVKKRVNIWKSLSCRVDFSNKDLLAAFSCQVSIFEVWGIDPLNFNRAVPSNQQVHWTMKGEILQPNWDPCWICQFHQPRLSLFWITVTRLTP